MSYQSKKFVNKTPKHEQEFYVNTKLLLNSNDDYQAPSTSHSLSPSSKWLIVRHNIHKIRSWGGVRPKSIVDQSFRDWYLFFQMRRELKRAEQEIRAIQNRKDFTPIRYFDLFIDEKRVRTYNVSHVRPSDGVFYAGLGSEPLILESLLYYFNKECVVPCNSLFYPFLSDVNSLLNTNRKRIQRVVVLRRVALLFALVVFIFIFIMFFSLILSVLTTASNLREMYKDGSDEGRMISQEAAPSLYHHEDNINIE